MKNSLRIHKWTHNEFNIFILGVLTHPQALLHGRYYCVAIKQIVIVTYSCFILNITQN